MNVKTLVVDDDIAVAGIHQGFVLAHGGFDVVGLAHTGADALRKVRLQQPDLVLLDIHLPDLSGLEVLRNIRLGSGDPPDVIAITAAREVQTVRAAISGGVAQYIVKPFSVATLHERLDAYLHERDKRQQAAGGQRLDQASIDDLMGVRPAATLQARVLPKGLAEPTLAVVTEALRAAQDASAVEIAQETGLSRVSARRYLEYLVSTGRATVQPVYGRSGRPKNRYYIAR